MSLEASSEQDYVLSRMVFKFFMEGVRFVYEFSSTWMRGIHSGVVMISSKVKVRVGRFLDKVLVDGS